MQNQRTGPGALSVDTTEIEVFLVLAEELHFGRTAERLRLPQPRVSRLVAALERRVGGTLFERTSRRVRLTPLGQQLAGLRGEGGFRANLGEGAQVHLDYWFE
jgi:Bacterial regulatory helix-turn-helix protein, lysR family